VSEIAFQFAQRSSPTLLVATSSRLVVQARVSKRQFCTYADRSQSDFDLRLAGILCPAPPTPRYDDASRGVDYEELTAALVLRATQRAEAKPITPTDARIGFRQDNRTCIRTPPLRNALGRRDSLEDDMRRRFDTPYKSETGHYFRPRASNSLRSA